MRYACREVGGTPEPALRIPRWPLDKERIFGVVIVSSLPFKTRGLRGGEMATVDTRLEPYDETCKDR